MFLSFNRCINARRRKLWGMHLFCIKYELIYSDAKSRDRFISETLSVARTFGQGEGHVVSLRVTWSWFGQSINQLTASWGSESPFSSLSIHKSKKSWSPLALPVVDQHLSTPSLPAYLLSERLIRLCAGMAPHRQLCTSKLLRLSLVFLSHLYSQCAFLLYLLDGHPKERTYEIFPLLYQICQDVDVEWLKEWRQQ